MCSKSRESEFFQLLDQVELKLFNWIKVKVYWMDEEISWVYSTGKPVDITSVKDAECQIIMKEIIATAWEKFDDYESGTKFNSWIFKFATNILNAYFREIKTDRTALQSLEKQLRIENLEKDDPYGKEHSDSRPFTHASSDGTYDDFMTFDEQSKKAIFNSSSFQEPLREAFRALSAGERQVFIERTYCDLTLAEVAEYNDMKIDTAKGYYSTARSKIQAKLSFDFYSKIPELMIAGLVAFPSELPVSYVSYMLMSLGDEFFQQSHPADAKIRSDVVSTFRNQIVHGDYGQSRE
jgi:RNA polymerase sigma factor (sigma-70 family)